MRFAGVFNAAVLAACALLAGCDGAIGSGDPGATKPAATTADDGAFNYRYAFRLPANRIEGVQESHARGCEQLGSARCRITAMRYRVGTGANGTEGGIVAVLTMTLDPAVARAFGKAAAQTVASAHGTMTDADVAGTDAARDGSVLAQLRDALGNAEAQQRTATTPEQKAQTAARAERLRSAIATIGEVDRTAGSGTVTAPVIFSYTSGGAIPGVGASPDATFDAAGDTFLSSLASLLVVLAGIGPWTVLLLGGALVLRWILARTESTPAPILPPAPHHDTEAGRNVIQRWFARDETKEHEPVE